jgi:hypothetical protein
MLQFLFLRTTTRHKRETRGFILVDDLSTNNTYTQTLFITKRTFLRTILINTVLLVSILHSIENFSGYQKVLRNVHLY